MQPSPATTAPTPASQEALSRLLGLAIFGERLAARTYNQCSRLEPRHAELLKRFATMEGRHARWFLEVSQANGVVPDKAFADRELGYLEEQVDAYAAAGDVEALLVVQGFIVESLAIATYEPFLAVSDRFVGAREAFQKALDEEHYHVDWVIRYLRLHFFDQDERFLELARRVNVQGVDCIGGTLMNIADHLDAIGLSGADSAGAMMDGYTGLLERVGIDERLATRDVVSLFMPLIRKYRHGREATA
ncbi:MAG: long-chain fatty aldehyde decarbonylase [Alphaproteobacteria bacterium]|nr:long-chain fatty aldehyde decarbonylase [Alphaproteobacteria bacterium]MCB9691697.1 long-chain fatty aldehyde decarbonylase [Alphaproteobacteria bacterium]